MAFFFAAGTFFVLKLVYVLISASFVKFVFIFFLMFSKFTPLLFFASFTTAPPHLPSILTLMSATRPIEIFFFIVFISTISTNLYTRIEIAFPLNQFYNFFFKLILFILKLCNLFFLFVSLIYMLLDFFN